MKLLGIIILLVVGLKACGLQRKEVPAYNPPNPTPKPNPSPGPQPNPDPGGLDEEAFAKVEPLILQNCATAGCHDGRGLQDFPINRWCNSAALQRIQDGTMPPGGRISRADKTALLNSFSDIGC